MKTHDHIGTIIDSTNPSVQLARKHSRTNWLNRSLIALGLLLSACVPIIAQPSINGTTSTPEVIGTPTSTQIGSPTYTPTATNTPEPTATPAPLEGRLFFDMNGSGLRDDASFNYYAERLTDERQPLQLDLLAAIEAFVASHPELKDGDLITLAEPGLSGFTVCAGDICTISTSDGSFVLPGAKSTSSLKITDPNAGTPALEMRYINKWNKAVTVPAYTKDVDVNTMASLNVVPGCKEDPEALVCKLNEDTLQVRDQHLNDTEILPISKTFQVGKTSEIGLMQGFLTSPLKHEKDVWLWSYVDLNYDPGVIENFAGSNSRPDYYKKITGTGDQHQGIDWKTEVGYILTSVAKGKSISIYEGDEGNAALQVRLVFQPGDAYGYTTDYGHNSVNLLDNHQIVYRGQIIGLSGKTGTEIPHLHFGMFRVPKSVSDNSWVVDEIFLNDDYPKVKYQDGGLVPSVFDPFRFLSVFDSFSLWSVDNLIIFFP